MLRHRRRRLRRIVLLGAAGLLLGSTACSPTYVLRAGWEEARILSARQPIDEVVRDTAAPRELREKLRLVRHARDYAERSLGLDAGRSFRSYVELERDTLVLVVSAAPEFELRWKTWWFPIVGHVPYKGYFDYDRALREAEELRRGGHDVFVRPAAAFSTLGWLPDPLPSTMLRMDSLALVETVIHEITHTTFFPAGEARFNESFATFVGNRGAVDYFCRGVADPVACERAEARWEDVRTFGRFFASIVPPLRELYATDLTAEEKRSGKREVFQEAARRYNEEVRHTLQAGRYGELDPEGLDNAWVLARILYYTRLDDFEAVYRTKGDLREAAAAIIRAAEESGDPWKGLDRLLAELAS